MSSSIMALSGVNPVAQDSATRNNHPTVLTLGMFIIDEFSYLTEDGQTDPSRQAPARQIGGGGTYAIIGARIWLQPSSLAMIVDKGPDFPQDIDDTLRSYAHAASSRSDAQSSSVVDDELMRGPFYFRPQEAGTTRALNSYKGDHRAFQYLTPRIRITPRDHIAVGAVRPPAMPNIMHFICSPARALEVIREAKEIGWVGERTGDGGKSRDVTQLIFEPIPDRCVPEELPALKQALPDIDVLSPNAEEALSLLGIPLPLSTAQPSYNSTFKLLIEEAAASFLSFGMRSDSAVVVRSGELGVYALSAQLTPSGTSAGRWISAYHTSSDRVVDVTGAGNAFLGGFAAGLSLAKGDIYEAACYGNVSAGFVIEQVGLPRLEVEDSRELWNGEVASNRLAEMKARSRSSC